MNYLYNAAGVKVEKKVHDTQNNTLKQVEYLDGFQYAGGILQFFPTAEGYVAATESTELLNPYIYNYVYNYTDHLGNIRLSYTKDPVTGDLEIMEENHYYPFGLKHAVYADPKQMYKLDEEEESLARPTYVYETEYQYKYNGKEWQDELGLNVYDYGARMYMPDIGRWGATDNKAELYFATSPYVYALNQPTNAIDPDGNLVIFINGNHYGDGGGHEYWRVYRNNYKTVNTSRGSMRYYSGKTEVYAFDRAVMNQVGDQRPIYRDGAIGGWAPLNPTGHELAFT